MIKNCKYCRREFNANPTDKCIHCPQCRALKIRWRKCKRCKEYYATNMPTSKKCSNCSRMGRWHNKIIGLKKYEVKLFE